LTTTLGRRWTIGEGGGVCQYKVYDIWDPQKTWGSFNWRSGGAKWVIAPPVVSSASAPAPPP